MAMGMTKSKKKSIINFTVFLCTLIHIMHIGNVRKSYAETKKKKKKEKSGKHITAQKKELRGLSDGRNTRRLLTEKQ